MISEEYINQVKRKLQAAYCSSCGGVRVLRKHIADELILNDLPKLLAEIESLAAQIRSANSADSQPREKG